VNGQETTVNGQETTVNGQETAVNGQQAGISRKAQAWRWSLTTPLACMVA
jgi:hypothetical protein